MSNIIENKDRIIETFQDIFTSIQNKTTETLEDDVTKYADEIRNLPNVDTVNTIELGTYSYIGTGSGVTGIFNLNDTGAEYFTSGQNVQTCIKEGYFTFILCAGEVTPVNNVRSNIYIQYTPLGGSTINYSCSITNSYSINFYYMKLHISVGDTINLYSSKSSSTAPIPTITLANSVIMYLITD